MQVTRGGSAMGAKVMKLRTLSLFSGIGGFDLGAEMTGRFEIVAFCEINPFCRAVLAKHWREVPCFHDVTKLTKDQINGPIDAICAGFPCQDLIFAGKGAGIEGARSGLWSQVVRLVGDLRPAIVMLENVPAILVRGLGAVLRDLAEIGYNGFWDCIRASDLGAGHHRDRWFLVAYPNSEQLNCRDCSGTAERGQAAASTRTVVSWDASGGGACPRAQDVANPNGERGCSRDTRWEHAENAGEPSGYSWHDAARMVSWHAEPDVGRVVNGISNRTHRLAALGNAIVPLWAFLVSKVAIAIYDHQNNPRPSIVGLPCASLPGAALAGGGESCSQSLFVGEPQ